MSIHLTEEEPERAVATPEPTVTFATARGMATRIVALQRRGSLTREERSEFVELATTLASLLAGDRVQVEIHLGLEDGVPYNGRADAPVSVVVKRFTDPPTDPVQLGDLVLDSAGRLAWTYRLSTGEGITLHRDPAAFALRSAELLLDAPETWSDPRIKDDPLCPPRTEFEWARERLTAALRAHGAQNVADDIETARDGEDVARIAQAAYVDEAITDAHAVLLAVLSTASLWLDDDGRYFALLQLLLDRLERHRPWTRRRFSIGPDDVLDLVVSQLGPPTFGISGAASAPGDAAREYIEAAIAAGAVLVPYGSHVLVEADENRSGRVRLAIDRSELGPQISYGWNEVKHLVHAESTRSPREVLRMLLQGVVNELNSLLEHY